MSEIVVVATLTSRPEKVEETRKLLTSLLAPTHADDGNVLYALHQGIDDPTRFTFVERWASAEALASHMKQPYMGEAFAQVGDLLAAAPDIVSMAPVLDGDAAKNAVAAPAG